MKGIHDENTCCGRFRNRVFFLVTSRAFMWAIIALILINTVLLAIEHYNMDKTVSSAD